MKTIIEKSATHDHVQLDADGTVLQEVHESSSDIKVIHSQEPAYIKLYVQDVLYLRDLPSSLGTLLLQLLTRATYADEEDGLCVSLTPYVKKRILEKLGWKKTASMNNALSKLVKGDIIRRLGGGTYQLNPYLFGKGAWKDVDKIRATWEYSLDGRTYSTAITYKDKASRTPAKAAPPVLKEPEEDPDAFEPNETDMDEALASIMAG